MIYYVGFSYDDAYNFWYIPAADSRPGAAVTPAGPGPAALTQPDSVGPLGPGDVRAAAQ